MCSHLHVSSKRAVGVHTAVGRFALCGHGNAECPASRGVEDMASLVKPNGGIEAQVGSGVEWLRPSGLSASAGPVREVPDQDYVAAYGMRSWRGEQ